MKNYFLSQPVFKAPVNQIDHENGIIIGVTVAQTGPARGHGGEIDNTFLMQLVDEGNRTLPVSKPVSDIPICVPLPWVLTSAGSKITVIPVIKSLLTCTSTAQPKKRHPATSLNTC
jgi:hypothetical protein